MPALDPEQRQAAILALVRRRAFVSNEVLAREFDVTVQTIRRDLDRLAQDGLLERHHGGAASASSIENIAYAERRVLNHDAKQAIAALVARNVPDHASLFIGIGTTAEACALALGGHSELRIVTNNLNVAAAMSRTPDVEVVIIGGRLRQRDGGIVGAHATDMIDQFRVDVAILGISGIDGDGALLDFDPDETRASRAILRNAKTTYLVADHTKFSRRPMVRMGWLWDVSALFTDRPPPPRIASMLRERGVALHIADPATVM